MKVTQKPRLHQDWIDGHAYGIVKALQRAGHTTYLVGGCVRDLLLGILPKDFDIATSAMPDEVRKIIYRSFVIGKRFRLVLVKRDQQQFEVSTFRREVRDADVSDEMAPAGDNVFGNPEEDARRRDFTINGLFYDPIADKLIDYSAGIPDLENRVIRMIGDPTLRIPEDPIRILRALRLSHKIGFALDPELREAMRGFANTLPTTVLPRRREEFLKLLRLRDPSLAFIEAYDLGLLPHLAPSLQPLFENAEQQEDFTQRLSQFHEKPVQREDTAELFGLFVHAVIRSAVAPDPAQALRAREILEHPLLGQLMRDELGMFKSEQGLLASALQIEALLTRRKEFEKRGTRRQHALMRNEAFPLALQFAERDLVLSPNDLLFWQELYRQYLTSNPSRGGRGGDGAPRRRRRRNRRPRRTSQASDQAGS